MALLLAALLLSVLTCRATRIWQPPHRQHLPQTSVWRTLSADLIHAVLNCVPHQPLLLWGATRGSFEVLSFGVYWPRAGEHHVLRGEILIAKFVSGDQVVSAGGQGEVILWDARTGQRLRTLYHLFPEEDQTRLQDMDVRPDGDQVVLLGHGSVIIGGLTLSSFAHRFQAGSPYRSAVRLLLGGAKVAVGTSPTGIEPVVVWDVPHAAGRFQLQPGAVGMEASLCGTRLATLSLQGVISVWSALDWTLVQEFRGLPRGCLYRHSIAISEQGARVAAGAAEGDLSFGRFLLWNGLTAAVLASQPQGGHDDFPRVAFFPGGNQLVIGGRTVVLVFDARSGEELRELKLSSSNAGFRHLAISPCGHYVALCGLSWQRRVDWVIVWEAASWTVVLEEKRELQKYHSKCSVAIGPPRSMAEVLAN